MKTQRHAAILRLIRRHTVKSQEQLRELLRAERFDVTQATLSRDIRELGLAKVAAPDGGSHYAAPPDGAPGIRPHLEQLLPTMLVSLDAVGPLVVLRTATGAPGIRPHLEQLLPTMLVSLDAVGPLVVLRTATGAAQSLGVALDEAGWSDVLGTIAGDDTLLVIARSERARRAVQTRLRELAGLP